MKRKGKDDHTANLSFEDEQRIIAKLTLEIEQKEIASDPTRLNIRYGQNIYKDLISGMTSDDVRAECPVMFKLIDDEAFIKLLQTPLSAIMHYTYSDLKNPLGHRNLDWYHGMVGTPVLASNLAYIAFDDDKLVSVHVPIEDDSYIYGALDDLKNKYGDGVCCNFSLNMPAGSALAYSTHLWDDDVRYILWYICDIRAGKDTNISGEIAYISKTWMEWQCAHTQNRFVCEEEEKRRRTRSAID
jgi:hypothetical protein